jgi:hypothetical protein
VAEEIRAVKVLAFSDLHRDREAAERLVALADEADVVVGAGDFASARLGTTQAIEPLKAIEKPAVLVPGNNESESELAEACAGWPSVILLHGESADIDGVTFFGLGGGVPVTPFPWSFDLSEREADAKVEHAPEGCGLVVHSPPKGYVDVAHGKHMGSERSSRRSKPSGRGWWSAATCTTRGVRRRRSAAPRWSIWGRQGVSSRCEVGGRGRRMCWPASARLPDRGAGK